MKYRYKLEGVDDDWIDAGAHNSVSYPNTGNGHFIFKVQASLGNGRWQEKVASLSITVVPPVWKRWWFISLVVLLVISVMIAVHGTDLMKF